MAELDDHRFLDLLYSAAVQPELWEPAIEAFADLVGGTSVWLSRLSILDGAGEGILARIDPAMPALYLGHYAAVNPLNNVTDPVQYISDWRPSILTDDDWMAKDDLVATEYYNDFLKPQDVHSTMMVRLGRGGTHTSVLNVNRPESLDRFSNADLERGGRLHSHLIRAFALGQKVMAGEPHTRGLATVFDASSAGLFMLDRDARVHRLNAAADALVMAGRGLRLQGGVLLVDGAPVNQRFHALVRRAASEDPASRVGGWLSISAGEGRPPLSVSVAPIPGPASVLFDSAPCVLVRANDLEGAPSISEEKLRSLFALTLAEARVALAILRGESPREAACSLGLSVHTVNNQLANVFQKTGVKRQSGLVKLLLRVGDLSL